MKTSKWWVVGGVLVVAILAFGAVSALAGTFEPVTVTDQTPTGPLANPVPSSYQPRYMSGFGTGDSFTVFFEDRDAEYTISYASTVTGPTGFPAAATATNIATTHFLVKDWPINIGGTDYAYRAWASVGNNTSHKFYVSNDLTNWTLVSTFAIPNAAGFADARGWVYYGFYDVIQLNGTYYAFAESNCGQTMIVRSDNGDDVWEAFASVGGTEPTDGPLETSPPLGGIDWGWTPTGSFIDLGRDRGYGAIYANPYDTDFYLAVNVAAQASLSPAALEAAFINPANWTWHDDTTGPASNPILSETSEHDLRECWVVPNSDPDADWVIIYDAAFGSADGGKALGYATLSPPLPPPEIVWVDDDYCEGCANDGHTWGYDAFATIQDGIDNVAGSTVNVAAGTYNEDVTIEEELTLNGAQAGVDARGRSTSESELVGVVKVTSAATNVVFDGFKFTSPTRGFTPRGFNLRVESKNSTIKNCIFVAEANEGHTYSGYLDFGGITNTTVERNSFSGDLDPTQEPNVILLGITEAGTVTVANNEMHDVGGGGGVGIMCSNDYAVINIEDNEFDNTGDGIWIWNGALHAFSVSITGNEIHNCSKIGVKLVGGGVGDVSIANNDFQNNAMQVFDDVDALDIEQVLENNTFDHAVTVDHPGASLLPRIWANIQDGIDAAVTGDDVIVASGTYTETVTVDNKAGLTLKSAVQHGAVVNGHVYINDSDNVTVDGFHINAASWGVFIRYSENVTTTGNKIVGAGPGGAHDGIKYGPGDGGDAPGTVSDNIIKDCDLGIYIDCDNHAGQFTVSDNTIENSRKAIGMGSLSGALITRNTIKNSTQVGIEIFKADISEAHFNNIEGNTSGVTNLDVTNTFDAEHNWWGSADGPEDTDSGTNEVTPANCGSSTVAQMLNAVAEISVLLGNKVSDNVDYCPWLQVPYPLTPMATFAIDHAKLDFKKKPDDDKVRVQGSLELDVTGNGVYISEDVTVTIGPLSETITMEEKGKKGDKWEYKRPKDGTGDIKKMTIDWKNGRFDIHMDKADLTGVTNPVFISIRIGDDVGSASILMREKKHHWDYKGNKPKAVEIDPLAITDELKVVAYPNPIRDVHTATFQVMGMLADQVEEIRVQIFDLSGHLVWEDAALGGELDWHTDSLSGDYLANGMYLYKVQVRIDGNWINQDIGKIAVLR